MRLGKVSTKSRSWKKAGTYGKPKYVSSEGVVGQISSDLITTVFAPKILELATNTLEQYADEWMMYEDQLRALEAETAAATAAEQVETAQETTKDESELGQDGDPHEVIVEDDGFASITVGTNKNQTTLPPPPPPPKEPLFRSQHLIDEFASLVLKETADHFMAKSGGWRIHANAAKFERMLDEKYGIFRPFITNHPEIEHLVRSVQRKYALGYFSPLRNGPPPIPRSTSIIILFMMYRGSMRWEIVTLSAMFLLVGLQPWALVLLVAVLQGIVWRRRRKRIGSFRKAFRKKHVPAYYHETKYDNNNNDDPEERDGTTRKHDLLKRNVGTSINAVREDELDTELFDTLFIGSGSATLYAAALLARAGRTVLVLSPHEDASGCLTLLMRGSKVSNESKQHSLVKDDYQCIPFDVTDSNVAKISKQQAILAPALCTSSDPQGGVRFAQIGSAADGYAFEILSIPGMGTADIKKDAAVPFVIQAAGGLASLMDDAAALLGDGWPGFEGDIGHSTTGAYVRACETINDTASLFYLSKILPESVNKIRKTSTYEECAIRQASGFLNKSFPLNAHTRSLMAGIGMKGENVKPSVTSLGAMVTNTCSTLSGEGMHYPVGGPRSLCRALAHIVEEYGGRVITDAPVVSLLFDEPAPKGAATKTSMEKANADLPPPTCVGVQLASGKEIRFASHRFNGSFESPVVVSMVGFIDTFIRLLPTEIRAKYNVPRGLPALSERRPVFHFLLLLQGNAWDLSLTGADYYRLPGAGLAQDEIDPETGAATFGEIGWLPTEGGVGTAMEGGSDNDDSAKDIIEATNEESTTEDKQTSKTSDEASTRKKRRRVVFEKGLSWMKISFPSAKDPSFEERHGKVTTCVVTVEADDDFVVPFDTKPRLYQPKKTIIGSSIEAQRLMERVTGDLFETYPQLEGKILHCEMRGPFQRGLSHNPERYAAKGVRTDTPYHGLFVGGSDLTVGDSFAASIVGSWLVANAVVGYSYLDLLFLSKNITSDLEQFLDPPKISNEDEGEDIAVPFTPPSTPKLEEGSTSAEDGACSAEPSKEE